MKSCTKCGEEKELTEFHKGKPRCKVCRCAVQREYAKRTRPARNATGRAWVAKNLDKRRASSRRYAAKRGHRYYSIMSRQYKLKHVTPPWACTEKIIQFYWDCPKGMEVDHILPVKGDTVTGLHVLANLQYLSATDNRKKANGYSQTR